MCEPCAFVGSHRCSVYRHSTPILRDLHGSSIHKFLTLLILGVAGFTGADLQNLMNEAAILAARRNLKEISKEEISDALERIVAGPEKKGAVMTEAKKRLVAYHEVRPLAPQELVCQSIAWSCLAQAMPWRSQLEKAKRWLHM